jgi:hypothetical protein
VRTEKAHAYKTVTALKEQRHEFKSILNRRKRRHEAEPRSPASKAARKAGAKPRDEPEEYTPGDDRDPEERTRITPKAKVVARRQATEPESAAAAGRSKAAAASRGDRCEWDHQSCMRDHAVTRQSCTYK